MILVFSLVFTAYHLNAVVSGKQHVFQVRIVLKTLVSLMSRLEPSSARIADMTDGNIHTDQVL